MIIYGCEIIKAIRGRRGEPDIKGIEYCDGWYDFENMGISVICAFDFHTSRYRVFCKDNFDVFRRLVESTDLVVGFNSIAFDNQLCAANGIEVPEEKSYDLLVEVWRAAGLGPTFAFPSHIGFGLEACAVANIGRRKTGDGTAAPILWQRGEIVSVIDYCLQDVDLTKRLLKRTLPGYDFHDPRHPDKFLAVKPPAVWAAVWERRA